MYNSTHASAWWPGKSKRWWANLKAKQWCNPTKLCLLWQKVLSNECLPLWKSPETNWWIEYKMLSDWALQQTCCAAWRNRLVNSTSLDFLPDQLLMFPVSQPRWKSGGLTINNCTNWQSIDNQHLLHWAGIRWLELQAQTFPRCAFAPRWLPV